MMNQSDSVYRILISDKLGDDGLRLLDSAGDVDYELKLDLSQDALINEIPHYDALIVRSGTLVEAAVIEAGIKLKVVGRAGIGVDNIDIESATKNGVVVMNTPQANAIATAEQTMALILSASRHLPQAHNSLLAGTWERSRFVGQQLYRKTLGVIGFGRIGRLVAARCLAFGMEILAYDPYVSEEIARELGVTLVDIEDLLEMADYITLHALLTPDTEEIIDSATIEKMKDGAIIINVARGKLIDEEALFAALASGKLKTAAVDVYQKEPPIGSPLIGQPNVIHTPHLGASTVEAQRDVATQIVEQVLDALRGTDFRNAINMPFAAGPDFEAARPHLELAEKLGTLQAALAPKPIRRIEVEVTGEMAERLLRPVATALFWAGNLSQSRFLSCCVGRRRAVGRRRPFRWHSTKDSSG
jgi:D-3-phosphoglycerate dehydrogenase